MSGGGTLDRRGPRTWDIRSADAGPRERLTSRGACQWYAGSAFALVYQGVELATLWGGDASTALKVGTTSLLLLLYVLFLAMPPLVWHRPLRHRVVAVLAWWACTCALFPAIGLDTMWVWCLLVVLIGFVWLPTRMALALDAAVVLTQLAIGSATGFTDTGSFAPVVTASVAAMMLAFSRQIMAIQQLRAAQSEIARLAAVDERARMARDLHDVLGHSLTVVTVKTELARRLIALDPGRAEQELREVEALARGALGDLRSSVADFRGLTLETELAAARTALDAAGIEADLPVDVAVVDERLRPVLAWVLREGVTNVLRHSGAHSCRVELGPELLSVVDDGPGPTARSAPPTPSGVATLIDADGSTDTTPPRQRQTGGSGIAGLRERASAAGLTVDAGPRADGPGFRLVAARVDAAREAAPAALAASGSGRR